jgi:hypothetical protein
MTTQSNITYREGRTVMTREEHRQFNSLASKLVDVIHDEIEEQGELSLAIITATLFDVATFWIAQCSVEAQQDMMRKFQENLLESIERGIAEKAETFAEISSMPFMLQGGEA